MALQVLEAHGCQRAPMAGETREGQEALPSPLSRCDSLELSRNGDGQGPPMRMGALGKVPGRRGYHWPRASLHTQPGSQPRSAWPGQFRTCPKSSGGSPPSTSVYTDQEVSVGCQLTGMGGPKPRLNAWWQTRVSKQTALSWDRALGSLRLPHHTVPASAPGRPIAPEPVFLPAAWLGPPWPQQLPGVLGSPLWNRGAAGYPGLLQHPA